jgi:hypothetical protein
MDAIKAIDNKPHGIYGVDMDYDSKLQIGTADGKITIKFTPENNIEILKEYLPDK